MLIEQKDKYISSLINLWYKVFGDEEEYIRLFFKEAYFDGECFVAEIDGEVVSALYLLKSDIKCDGKAFKGRYLYAAATLPEYRGQGLMSKLINEALDYVREEKLDFIALVPADDGLYDYYSRFGFYESMYKYKYTTENNASTMRAYREIYDSKEFSAIRNSSSCDMLIYNDICNRYAFECLNYGGIRVFYLNDNSYYAEGEELFCDDVDSAINLINNLSGESVIYTNCRLEKAEKIRNGMIYRFNDELKNKEIYMNIALD